MHWKLSLPNSPMLVYYFAKFMGLAPFTLKNGEVYPPTVLYLIYPITLAVAYLLCNIITYRSEMQHLDSSEFRFKAIGFSIQRFQAVPSIFLTLIIFSLMYKKIIHLINEFCVVGNEFRKMGIQEDREQFFKNLLITTALANLVLIATCVVLGFRETGWPAYLSIQSGIENLYILNTILIFTQLLLCIRQRFTLLNRKFYDMYSPTRPVRPPQDLQILRDIQLLLKIEGLHMELCNLVDQTINLFTTSIIFISLKFLSTLSVSVFWIYHVSQTSNQPSDIADIASFFIDNFLNTSLRAAIVIVELFTIACVSTTTSKEAKATKSILSEVWQTSTPRDLQDEFFTFYLQLMHKSGSIALLGFFDLDYSYVYKIFSATAAYLIVVIQFNTAE